LAYVGFNSPAPPRDAVAVSVYERYLVQFAMLEKYLEEFATITSLPLKLLLIGFCYWALKEGRLAFHMEKTRSMIKNVPAEWDQFQNSFAETPNPEGGDRTMVHSAGT
jgi:hypothetical protein